MKTKELSRRRFIALAAAGTGGMLFLTRCSNPQRFSLYRFFSEEEAQLVDAIVDQIIPPDEWAGGKDAGVTHFIDRQLAGVYNRFQERYTSGLNALKATCESLYQKTFPELDWEEQTNFLRQMDGGKLAELRIIKNPGKPEEGYLWENGEDSAFFRLLRDHAMQGFYGSPRHGGNLNYVSYKMIRLDYPLIIGQNRYKS